MEYRNVGSRIRARLVCLNYVKPNGDLDVERFSWDHRLGRTNLYNWLGDKAVPFKDLIPLCDALQCDVRWLLTGEAPKALPRQRRGRVESVVLALALGGGLVLSPSPSVAARARTVASNDLAAYSTLSEVRRRRRFRNKISIIGAGSAYAA